MSTAWTAYPFKRAVVTAVAARAGITGLSPSVAIRTDFPSLAEPITDSIIVGYRLEDRVEVPVLKNEPAGAPHDETVEVYCQIRTARAGGGETVAQAAEDRARTILSEVDAELRENIPTVSGAQIFWARISERSSTLLDRRSNETPMKVCLVQFRVTYKARTAP